MIPVIIGIVGIAITAWDIYSDYATSQDIANSVSQLESFFYAIQGEMSFSEFLSSCWMILVLGFFIFWFGLAIAFPKKTVHKAFWRGRR